MNFGRNDQNSSTIAGSRSLGWASLGIGLAELLAPAQVQSLLGLEDRSSHRGILRVLGVRELLHGASILTERQPTQKLALSVWSRVAGDLLDTALLGLAAARTKHPARFAGVSASVLGIGVLDMLFSRRLLEERRSPPSLWERGREMIASRQSRSPWQRLVSGR